MSSNTQDQITDHTIYAIVRQYREADTSDNGRRIVAGYPSEAEATAACPPDYDRGENVGENYWMSVEAITPSKRLAAILESGSAAQSQSGDVGVIAAGGKWLVHDGAGAMIADRFEDDDEHYKYWTAVINRNKGLNRHDWDYLRAATAGPLR